MDATSSTNLIRALTAPVPRSLWIELTSVCPFDCVFCSRRMRRGNGEHMPFELYERIVGSLHRPEVIRLNYSGESIHYPRLAEAIRLAKASGAHVELVTALASATRDHIRALNDSGLDRLTISLHALDAELYRRIYRFASADKLQTALAGLDRERGPSLDLSFVAMAENLDELPGIVRFAANEGIRSIAVHPVIRRDLIPLRFEAELTDGRDLRPDFAARIEQTAAQARKLAPGVDIQIARPPAPAHHTGHTGFATCEQNPWETVHILANGDVVACEVQDHIPLGSLAEATLAEIWHGEPYSAFRERFQSNRDNICSRCEWYQFSPVSSSDPVWLRGWHTRHEGDTVRWSERAAAIWIPGPAIEARFGLTAVLPPASNTEPLRVEIVANGHPVGEVSNASTATQTVDFSAYLPAIETARSDGALFTFECSHTYSPSTNGSADLRRLGFGLHSLELNPPPAPAPGSPAKHWLAQRLLRVRPSSPLRLLSPPTEPGVSILIPESGTPEVLTQCLAALSIAIAHVDEPTEVIVWVNGADPSAYAELTRHAHFHFTPRRQGSSQAVHAALARARHPWVYLLNSDAMVAPDALTEVLKLRDPSRFAIASQIESFDSGHRRIESNFTRLATENGLAHTWDAYPAPAEPQPIPYAGATAALYQRDALRVVSAATSVYDPFYWEDVEWGVAAARAGLSSWLAPASRVQHLRRSTIGKHFASQEVERVFERNRLLFQLRGNAPAASIRALHQAVARAPWKTLVELWLRR